MASRLMMSLAVLVLLLTSSILGQVTKPLRVGSWNIRDFGPTKMGNPVIVDAIVKVMRFYDIIAILEISDKTNQTPTLLNTTLNQGQKDTYEFVLSSRVGTSSQKEQYAYYWKKSRVTKVSDAPANDGGKFAYSPYVVTAESVINSQLKKFGLVVVHVRPNATLTSITANQISALSDVYKSYKAMNSIEDILIMGDFNAGCTYLKSTDWPNIALRTDKSYNWLVADNVDTTTSTTTNCSYDRIVAAGKNMLAISMAGTVDKYESRIGVSLTTAQSVSDHYPVYVDIPISKRRRNIAVTQTTHSVTFASTAELITDFARSKSHICSCDDFVADAFTSKSIDEALENSKNKYSLVLPKEAVDILEYKINAEGSQDLTQYDEGSANTSYDVTLLCQISKDSCILSFAPRNFLD